MVRADEHAGAALQAVVEWERLRCLDGAATGRFQAGRRAHLQAVAFQAVRVEHAGAMRTSGAVGWALGSGRAR